MPITHEHYAMHTWKGTKNIKGQLTKKRGGGLADFHLLQDLPQAGQLLCLWHTGVREKLLEDLVRLGQLCDLQPHTVSQRISIEDAAAQDIGGGLLIQL